MVASILFALMFCNGCDVNLGPPLPEVYAEKAMRATEQSEDTIHAVLAGLPIASNVLAALLTSPDVSLRHMLARNPTLDGKARWILLRDADGFVRSGLALNPSLTSAEVEALMRDTDARIANALAINAAVPNEALIALRSQRGVELIYFAQNPRCPQPIQQEIQESRNTLAQSLLSSSKKRRDSGDMRAQSPGGTNMADTHVDESNEQPPAGLRR